MMLFRPPYCINDLFCSGTLSNPSNASRPLLTGEPGACERSHVLCKQLSFSTHILFAEVIQIITVITIVTTIIRTTIITMMTKFIIIIIVILVIIVIAMIQINYLYFK